MQIEYKMTWREPTDREGVLFGTQWNLAPITSWTPVVNIYSVIVNAWMGIGNKS